MKINSNLESQNLLSKKDDEILDGPPIYCCTCSVIAGIALTIISQFPYDCSDCPMTAGVVSGITLIGLSTLAFLANIYYGYTVSQTRKEHKCTMVCSTIYFIAAIVLNITGTVLFSKICRDLDCP